jgi:adenylate cyclase
VRCAVAMQEAAERRAEDKPEKGRIVLRIGINLGDIIAEESEIYGDGVNVAVRLEGIAPPGGICVSAKVYDELHGKLSYPFDNLGERELKNIARPVRVYSLRGMGEPHAASAVPARLTPKPLPLPDKPSIAVLPFTNMSGDPEQEYFADGVVEDIITALSRMKWFFVIARNSSFTYKGRAVDVRQVGRDLGVRYVLEGSIRKAAYRVRITGQLIEAESGRHIWADRFDGELADIFELQDQVTTSIVSAIEPSLRVAEIERARKKPTADLGAYDLYLRALFDWYSSDAGGITRARQLLRQTVEQDPTYSDAWALLAQCALSHWVRGWQSHSDAKAEGCEAALKAVSNDPENGAALAAAAWVLAMLGGNYDQAREFADRALVLHPNSAHVRTQCGLVYTYGGDSEEALRHLHHALRINPTEPRRFAIFTTMATAHFFKREFSETIRWAKRALAEKPSYPVALRYLAAAYGHSDLNADAREAIDELLRVQPNSSLTRSYANSFGHPWMLDFYIDGLRRAGLPE